MNEFINRLGFVIKKTATDLVNFPGELKKTVQVLSKITIDLNLAIPIIILFAFFVFVKRYDKKDAFWWLSLVFLVLLVLFFIRLVSK